ncbi:hypothetical protein [Wenjunlia tyrosinilytica]|uniref:Uncharacterized protein n=1 Tax=Wenjunlia tyrosinilytica TaxID=1544741 RepID=A0A917ZU74_9ACTN|nr:hypothetical protein [Wenjunlia tyrosinilytica]GGO93222.1 hypothetical protein GCM10012280_45250 [Wenjunlia tyrosinilytica]
MQTVLRSATLATAMAALALTGIAMAPSANATTVPCSADPTGNYWGLCDRYTDDGDSGGVSGSVELGESGDYDTNISNYFDAKGEHVYLFNEGMNRTLHFRVYWKDSAGRIHTAVDTSIAPNGPSKDYDLSLAEGVQVGIDIRSNATGRVALNSLRA